MEQRQLPVQGRYHARRGQPVRTSGRQTCRRWSAPSASLQPPLLILDPSKGSLIAVRAIAAGGTDDADGADGVSVLVLTLTILVPSRPSRENAISIPSVRRNCLPCCFKRRFTPAQATSPPSEPAEQAAPPPQDQTQQSGTALPRSSITALQVCVCARRSRPASARIFLPMLCPPKLIPSTFRPQMQKV